MCVLRKKQVFVNISLSRNTVAKRIEDFARDLNCHLKEKFKTLIVFSLALNESTDINEVAQLGLFFRGVDESLTITNEFDELLLQTQLLPTFTPASLVLWIDWLLTRVTLLVWQGMVLHPWSGKRKAL